MSAADYMQHRKYKKYFSETQICERLFSLSLFLNFKDLTCRKDKQTIGKGMHPFHPLEQGWQSLYCFLRDGRNV